MTIEQQKEGESLEDRVNGTEEEDGIEAVEEILDSLPEPEFEEVEVEGKKENPEIELAEIYPSTEPEPEFETAPVGPADYQDDNYIGPQVLEEACQFLNKYGVMTDNLSPKEVMDKIKKIHAAKDVAAQVLSRGRAIDGIERILSFVPDGYIGEFKRENDIDVARARTLGFDVFKSEEAKLESSTGKADGLVRFGDQILMIIPEEMHIANRLVKADRLAERRKAHTRSHGSLSDPLGDGKGANKLFPLIKL